MLSTTEHKWNGQRGNKMLLLYWTEIYLRKHSRWLSDVAFVNCQPSPFMFGWFSSRRFRHAVKSGFGRDGVERRVFSWGFHPKRLRLGDCTDITKVRNVSVTATEVTSEYRAMPTDADVTSTDESLRINHAISFKETDTKWEWHSMLHLSTFCRFSWHWYSCVSETGSASTSNAYDRYTDNFIRQWSFLL